MRAERRAAVDTSVVLNFLTGDDDHPERRVHSEWVFRAGRLGTHRLVLPAIVITEAFAVAKIRAPEPNKNMRDKRVETVRRWMSSTDFLVADIDERVAMAAADYSVRFQLKAMDSCVLAASIVARASVLYTWDKKMLAVGEQLSGIAVVQPKATEDEQGSLLD